MKHKLCEKADEEGRKSRFISYDMYDIYGFG